MWFCSSFWFWFTPSFSSPWFRCSSCPCCPPTGVRNGSPSSTPARAALLSCCAALRSLLGDAMPPVFPRAEVGCCSSAPRASCVPAPALVPPRCAYCARSCV
ncbi:hypothetical protein DFH08DRAFT_490127 [Mycena albidolilacea]|uniref:Secreted protein n=1 Tax=Mycena albidolilacea TaxID=1033008 RepID=A0AAD7EBL0_9AGAR|nr:hypothetical protein DFH08DRAFT_490127 [Mycena albidolilacea]